MALNRPIIARAASPEESSHSNHSGRQTGSIDESSAKMRKIWFNSLSVFSSDEDDLNADYASCNLKNQFYNRFPYHLLSDDSEDEILFKLSAETQNTNNGESKTRKLSYTSSSNSGGSSEENDNDQCSKSLKKKLSKISRRNEEMAQMNSSSYNAAKTKVNKGRIVSSSSSIDSDYNTSLKSELNSNPKDSYFPDPIKIKITKKYVSRSVYDTKVKHKRKNVHAKRGKISAGQNRPSGNSKVGGPATKMIKGHAGIALTLNVPNTNESHVRKKQHIKNQRNNSKNNFGSVERKYVSRILSVSESEELKAKTEEKPVQQKNEESLKLNNSCAKNAPSSVKNAHLLSTSESEQEVETENGEKAAQKKNETSLILNNNCKINISSSVKNEQFPKCDRRLRRNGHPPPNTFHSLSASSEEDEDPRKQIKNNVQSCRFQPESLSQDKKSHDDIRKTKISKTSSGSLGQVHLFTDWLNDHDNEFSNATVNRQKFVKSNLNTQEVLEERTSSSDNDKPSGSLGKLQLTSPICNSSAWKNIAKVKLKTKHFKPSASLQISKLDSLRRKFSNSNINYSSMELNKRTKCTGLNNVILNPKNVMADTLSNSVKQADTSSTNLHKKQNQFQNHASNKTIVKGVCSSEPFEGPNSEDKNVSNYVKTTVNLNVYCRPPSMQDVRNMYDSFENNSNMCDTVRNNKNLPSKLEINLSLPKEDCRIVNQTQNKVIKNNQPNKQLLDDKHCCLTSDSKKKEGTSTVLHTYNSGSHISSNIQSNNESVGLLDNILSQMQNKPTVKYPKEPVLRKSIEDIEDVQNSNSPIMVPSLGIVQNATSSIMVPPLGNVWGRSDHRLQSEYEKQQSALVLPTNPINFYTNQDIQHQTAQQVGKLAKIYRLNNTNIKKPPSGEKLKLGKHVDRISSKQRQSYPDCISDSAKCDSVGDLESSFQHYQSGESTKVQNKGERESRITPIAKVNTGGTISTGHPKSVSTGHSNQMKYNEDLESRVRKSPVQKPQHGAEFTQKPNQGAKENVTRKEMKCLQSTECCKTTDDKEHTVDHLESTKGKDRYGSGKGVRIRFGGRVFLIPPTKCQVSRLQCESNKMNLQKEGSGHENTLQNKNRLQHSKQGETNDVNIQKHEGSGIISDLPAALSNQNPTSQGKKESDCISDKVIGNNSSTLCTKVAENAEQTKVSSMCSKSLDENDIISNELRSVPVTEDGKSLCEETNTIAINSCYKQDTKNVPEIIDYSKCKDIILISDTSDSDDTSTVISTVRKLYDKSDSSQTTKPTNVQSKPEVKPNSDVDSSKIGKIRVRSALELGIPTEQNLCSSVITPTSSNMVAQCGYRDLSGSDVDTEKMFFKLCDKYFDEIVNLKIPKLAELLHLAIADDIRKEERWKQADHLASPNLVEKEKIIAEKDFDYVMTVRGQEFVPLFLTITKRFELRSKKSLVMVLYCRLFTQLERIDPINVTYKIKLRNIILAMILKHNSCAYIDYSIFAQDDRGFLNNLCFIENHLRKYEHYLWEIKQVPAESESCKSSGLVETEGQVAAQEREPQGLFGEIMAREANSNGSDSNDITNRSSMLQSDSEDSLCIVEDGEEDISAVSGEECRPTINNETSDGSNTSNIAPISVGNESSLELRPLPVIGNLDELFFGAKKLSPMKCRINENES